MVRSLQVMVLSSLTHLLKATYEFLTVLNDYKTQSWSVTKTKYEICFDGYTSHMTDDFFRENFRMSRLSFHNF